LADVHYQGAFLAILGSFLGWEQATNLVSSSAPRTSAYPLLEDHAWLLVVLAGTLAVWLAIQSPTFIR